MGAFALPHAGQNLASAMRGAWQCGQVTVRAARIAHPGAWPWSSARIARVAEGATGALLFDGMRRCLVLVLALCAAQRSAWDRSALCPTGVVRFDTDLGIFELTVANALGRLR